MSGTFNHNVIVAQHDLRRHAVTLLKSGKVEKSFSTVFPLDVQLLPDKCVLCTGDGDAIRLDEDFKEIWRLSFGRHGILSAQLIGDGRIVVGDMSRSRICIVDDSKNILSQFDFPLVKHPDEYYLGFRMLRVLDNRSIMVAAHKDEKLLVFDFDGNVLRDIDLAGPPYLPLRLSNGEIWVSLGPSGKIARFDGSFNLIGNYDMQDDSGLECGWIAGLSETPDGTVVYSDSKYDRLVELDIQCNLLSIFQDRNELLHPSTCVAVS